MKFKGVVILGFALVGVLFTWHIFRTHSGFSGFRAGLGLNGS